MDTKQTDHIRQRSRSYRADSSGAGVYVFGLIGTAVYYIQNAATVGGGVIGLLKALVWPAFLVYHVLRFIHA